jgi:hypothetical protein
VSEAYIAPLRDQVSKWLASVHELIAQIAVLEKGRADLEARIAAAELLLGGKSAAAPETLASAGARLAQTCVATRPAPPPAAPRARAHAREAEGSASSLTAAIAELMEDGQSRSTAQIRAALVAAGRKEAAITSKSGHFYTLLRELVEDGTLIRDHDHYRRAGATTPAPEPRSDDVTAELMGDPLPGRSALARRATAGV